MVQNVGGARSSSYDALRRGLGTTGDIFRGAGLVYPSLFPLHGQLFILKVGPGDQQ